MSTCYRCVFVFKQKTAYEMSISDWSSDVCSSDLLVGVFAHDQRVTGVVPALKTHGDRADAAGATDDQDAAPAVARQAETVEQHFPGGDGGQRSEERRVGQECGSKC